MANQILTQDKAPQHIPVVDAARLSRAQQNIRDCGEDVEQEIEFFLELHAGRYSREEMIIDLDRLVRRAFRNGAASVKN